MLSRFFVYLLLTNMDCNLGQQTKRKVEEKKTLLAPIKRGEGGTQQWLGRSRGEDKTKSQSCCHFTATGKKGEGDGFKIGTIPDRQVHHIRRKKLQPKKKVLRDPGCALKKGRKVRL